MPNNIHYTAKSFTKLGVEIRGEINISELTETEAREYAELMKTHFLRHWKKCKSNSKTE